MFARAAITFLPLISLDAIIYFIRRPYRALAICYANDNDYCTRSISAMLDEATSRFSKREYEAFRRINIKPR